MPLFCDSLFAAVRQQAELGKELQNGRLFRLMTKLQMVVERPEQNQDPRWADTGDRYMLKLLKNYIFHRVHTRQIDTHRDTHRETERVRQIHTER